MIHINAPPVVAAMSPLVATSPAMSRCRDMDDVTTMSRYRDNDYSLTLLLYSYLLFRVAKQIVQKNKDVVGGCCVKDKDGKLVIEECKINMVWKEYFDRLLNEEFV